MLRVFSDCTYLPPGQKPTILLRPFWGLPPEDPSRHDAGRFDAYYGIAPSLFTLTSLEACDIVAAPGPWIAGDSNDAIRRLAHRARAAGKRTLIFFNSDSEEPVDIPETVVFRTSFWKSRRRANEFALPAWSIDLPARYAPGGFAPREWTPVPVVSYCGYATRSPSLHPPHLALTVDNVTKLNRLAQSTGKPFSHFAAALLREEALLRLEQAPEIETNFLIRDGFWGAGEQARGRSRADLHREYAENLLAGDYVLCLRGAGNFSFRFYETLNCGRIPLFVDTDCVLPFEAQIDWKKYCVWVDRCDLASIAESLTSFHARHEGQTFTQLQRECRMLWEDWLSPQGFFTQLSQRLAP
jgi:hypothetical protein